MTDVKAKNTISIVFGVLLSCLTLLSAWQLMVITEQNKQIKSQNEKFEALPEKYVRLERYVADMRDIKQNMSEIRDNIRTDLNAVSTDIKELTKSLNLQFNVNRKNTAIHRE